jgi:putative oxidoreductase
MTDDRLRSYGVLLLRLSLDTMFLAHSVIYTLLTMTLSGTSDFFNSIGLPSWLAYATCLAEVVGGIFLILGIQTRWVALALSPILIGGEILSPQPRHFSRGYGPSTADDYGRQTGSSKRN